MSIEAIGLTKRFGDFVALRDVDLQVRPGELLALLGPSGSGKTTLLRIIAGLDWPDVGDVRINGDSVVAHGARERRIGFVFQHYALFRHMTVFENVAFGLRVRPRRERPPEARIRERVQRLLDLVQIGWLADRRPSELSGGQRQRVALARALAIEPKVLLLDEPFGALDAKVRKELRRWLRSLHSEMQMTTIFVTHDQEEAMEVADRVVIMSQGRIEQAGTPAEVYDRPANPFVIEFLGSVNRLPATLHGDRVVVPGIAVEVAERVVSHDASVDAFVRPHDIEIERSADGNGTVTFVGVSSGIVRVDVLVDGHDRPIEVEVFRPRFRTLNIETGDRVKVHACNVRLFPGAKSSA